VITIAKGFAEDDETAVRAGLLMEFNSLSICYGKTSEHFVGEAYRIGQASESALEASIAALDVGAAAAQVAAPVAAGEAYNDLLGFVEGPAAAATAAAPAKVVGGSVGMKLNPSASVDGQKFQTLWGQLEESVNSMYPMGMTPISNTKNVEDALLARSVLTMASGEMPNEFKFFLYAQEESSGGLFLIQALVDKTCQPQLLNVLVKTEVAGGRGAVLSEELVGVLKEALGC